MGGALATTCETGTLPVFEILLTIMGHFEDEAEALDFAQDLEDSLARARQLGFVIEVRDERLAKAIRRRLILPTDQPC